MICNTGVIFEVLVKCIRDGSIYVYCCEVFLICLGEFLLQGDYAILKLLFIWMLALADEESLELEVVYSTIAEGINCDVLQKLS